MNSLIIDYDANNLDQNKINIITEKFFDKVYYGTVEKIEDDNKNCWSGICYGTHNYILFCLSISKCNDGNNIWCTFLYDSTSKYNYLSPKTIEKLDIKKEHTFSNFKIKINGIKTTAYSTFFHKNKINDDVNIIGHDFLSCLNGDLVLQYVDGICRPKIYCNKNLLETQKKIEN